MADLGNVLDQLLADLDSVRGELATKSLNRTTEREGSRYLRPGADESLVARVAAGGTASTAAPSWRGAESKSTAGLGEMYSKALSESTGSAGGYLVEPEVAAEVMSLIRARSVVSRIGPTTIPVKKSLAVTSISSGASAAYVAENAAIPPSEMTFTQVPILQPKELAALVPVSNRLLDDARSNPSIENVLRRDLAEILALRGDLAFLRGTGTAGEPSGWRNTPGLTAALSLGANGGTPTFDTLKSTVEALRAAGGTFENPAWIFNPRLLSTLEMLKTSDGAYLADAGLLEFDARGGTGTLLGIEFWTSTQVPTNLTVGSSTDTSEVYLTSDSQELWIGEGADLEIQASGEASYTPDGGTTWVSAFQNRQTLFRAVVRHDIALRRPQWFTVLSGVRA